MHLQRAACPMPVGADRLLRLVALHGLDQVDIGVGDGADDHFSLRCPSIRIQGTTAARANQIQQATGVTRSEEHTSELQSLMRISYAVFCLKKKKQTLICNIIN